MHSFCSYNAHIKYRNGIMFCNGIVIEWVLCFVDCRSIRINICLRARLRRIVPPYLWTESPAAIERSIIYNVASTSNLDHTFPCMNLSGCARLIWISWISWIMDILDFLDYMDFCRIKEMQTAKVASGSRIIPS